MSKKELGRVEVMERMKAKKMTQKKGEEALGIGVRQVRRIWKNYQEKGVVGLISKRPFSRNYLGKTRKFLKKQGRIQVKLPKF